MKILCSANNSYSSSLYLQRFVESCKYKIITAGYKSKSNYNFNYNLEALLNFSNPNPNISLSNDNYKYYVNEIRRHNFDLIISDLDIYTSVAAIDLNIPLWQAGPSLLYYALDHKTIYNIGIYKKYSNLFNDSWRKSKYIKYIINNSNKNFVVSHFCDIETNLKLNDNFEFARPEFHLCENKSKYKYLGVSNKKSIDIIKHINNKNSVYCSNISEKYDGIHVDKYTSYVNHLNSDIVICDGDPTILSDAFYNQKSCTSFPNVYDTTSLFYSYAGKYFGLNAVNDRHMDLPTPNIKLNNNITFLKDNLYKL